MRVGVDKGDLIARIVNDRNLSTNAHNAPGPCISLAVNRTGHGGADGKITRQGNDGTIVDVGLNIAVHRYDRHSSSRR